MPTSIARAPRPPSWSDVCRSHYGLTPGEFGTLAAIATFNEVVQAPMPRHELERAAAKAEHAGDIDLTTPGRLMALGLITLIGYRERRFYEVTRAGRERLAR